MRLPPIVDLVEEAVVTSAISDDTTRNAAKEESELGE